MALNFPDSPSLNQVYTDTTSGFSYQWDGVVWKSYAPASSSQIRIIDDISGSFNGSTQTFTLTVSSESISPANAQQLRVVLGGIVQEPLTDYTVSGSNITFTTPPSGGLDCSIISLGPAIPLSVPGDGTVTPAKLSTGGPSWNSGGDVVISGILTVGTSSLTLNGDTNQINGVTISSGIVTATSFYGGSATITGNVSIAGTLTYEDVTNVDSIGIVTARAGIVLGPTSNTIQLGTGTTISSPASDTFTILTGGSERVRVSSAGSFGIGTASPTTLLQVAGTSGSSQFRAGTASNGYFEVNAFDSNPVYCVIAGSNATAGVFGTQSNIPLIWFTNNTERARISTTGGFSVGTTANPGAGAIYATGDITAFYSSDIRLKKDIEPISEPIKKLMEISGVTYKWNEEYLKDKDVDGYFVRETEVGVIAQEVEKVLPEVVATRENGYKAVRYEKLVALLIEAVKDQQHQIDELKARLEEK